MLKQTYKPSFVFHIRNDNHSSGTSVTGRLMRSTRKHRTGRSQTFSYLILLRARFTLPILSPELRWALTPPFHHCLFPRKRAIGCIFSVALSVGSLRLGVTQRPALWSSDFPPASSADASDYPVCFSIVAMLMLVYENPARFVKRKAPKAVREFYLTESMPFSVHVWKTLNWLLFLPL